jgi:hypothetical protein
MLRWGASLSCVVLGLAACGTHGSAAASSGAGGSATTASSSSGPSDPLNTCVPGTWFIQSTTGGCACPAPATTGWTSECQASDCMMANAITFDAAGTVWQYQLRFSASLKKFSLVYGNLQIVASKGDTWAVLSGTKIDVVNTLGEHTTTSAFCTATRLDERPEGPVLTRAPSSLDAALHASCISQMQCKDLPYQP